MQADPAGLVELLQDPAVADALLCSHGELIGAVLRRLAADGRMGDGELQWPKGSTWVLTVDDRRVRQSQYLPPLRVQDPVAGYY